jgi:hypothetical protein
VNNFTRVQEPSLVDNLGQRDRDLLSIRSHDITNTLELNTSRYTMWSSSVNPVTHFIHHTAGKKIEYISACKQEEKTVMNFICAVGSECKPQYSPTLSCTTGVHIFIPSEQYSFFTCHRLV